MGQETHYYNNVIAQLVELRDETKKGNEETQAGMTAKLDEVIDAIEKIQVTAENIKIEAGTINLSTNEVEALLKNVNTNLGIINSNINEFDTNVNTELEKFITAVQTEFTTFTNFIIEQNAANKTLLTEEFVKLTTNIDKEFDKLILVLNNNHDAIINTVADEFTKLKTDNATNKDEIVKSITDEFTKLNTNIDTELDALKINDNTNNNVIIEKLNTTITQIGDITSPVEGSIAKLIRTINDNLTNSGTDNETNLTALKTAIETASSEIQNIIAAKSDLSNAQLENINTVLRAESVQGPMDYYSIFDVLYVLMKTIGYSGGFPNRTGSIVDVVNYISIKQESILTEIANIKAAINSQTTSITNAMTTQTEAIVNAINNITNNGTKSIVMVDTPPPIINDFIVRINTIPNGIKDTEVFKFATLSIDEIQDVIPLNSKEIRGYDYIDFPTLSIQYFDNDIRYEFPYNIEVVDENGNNLLIKQPNFSDSSVIYVPVKRDNIKNVIINISNK